MRQQARQLQLLCSRYNAVRITASALEWPLLHDRVRALDDTLAVRTDEHSAVRIARRSCGPWQPALRDLTWRHLGLSEYVTAACEQVSALASAVARAKEHSRVIRQTAASWARAPVVVPAVSDAGAADEGEAGRGWEGGDYSCMDLALVQRIVKARR